MSDSRPLVKGNQDPVYEGGLALRRITDRNSKKNPI